MADAADQVTTDDERAMAKFEEEQRLARIAASMRVYDASVPLNCVECAEIIPPERLKAYPRTARCVDCASDVELRNGWGSPR